VCGAVEDENRSKKTARRKSKRTTGGEKKRGERLRGKST